MFGYIILRDIPKKAAQLDLLVYEINGGFRGFSNVSSGLHYITIQVNEKMHEGFWCFIKPSMVVIKVYDYVNNAFIEDTPENIVQYSRMALSGAMNQALIPAFQRNAKELKMWSKIVSYVTPDKNLPILHSETPMVPPRYLTSEELSDWHKDKQKSRFEQVFYDTHKGKREAFLSEFQFAFAHFLVRNKDELALERYFHLLLSIYNASERNVSVLPVLFSDIIDTLMIQFKYLPNSWFESGSKIVAQANYLIEDVIDSGNNELERKVNEFAKYIEYRKENIYKGNHKNFN